MRRSLFASKYPVSEYTDNVGRIGKMIMDRNLNCHGKCHNKACQHPYTVDLSEHPSKKRMECKYIKNSCGGLSSEFETEKSHDFRKVC